MGSHAARLLSPWYSDNEGAVLQRYFVPEFVQKFQRDLQGHQLGTPAARAWKASDRFSEHDNKVVLRLPVHKSFYVISCEIACNQPGFPAFDIQKISSAGFVIRRFAEDGEQSWMIEDDEPLGWEESPTGLRDPDVHRRLCRDGTLHPRDLVPTYTGEETHPLHPLKVVDEKGKCRTVLFGYVALGGSYMHRQNGGGSPFDTPSLQAFSRADGEQLRWPYGYRMRSRKRWLNRYARPIRNGVPTKAFFEMLRMLVNRYHLGEVNIEENEALRQLAQGIYFYDQPRGPNNLTPENYNDYARDSFIQWRKYSLWSWLERHFSSDKNDLVAWIERQEKIIDDAGGIDKNFAFEALPSASGSSDLGYSLYLTAGDARDFRNRLDQRALDLVQNMAKEIPIPKFQQGKEDIYQIVPFVRVLDDNGKERIIWADEQTRSEAFRVAAPFDADASRPSLIQMPSLSDLKKGLAKGVGILTPPDTFSLLSALNLKKGASEDVIPSGEPGGLGIQWICSFSLPVITLVAMILLMIMISLLNILFFWLPWVKICLPFPKIK